MILYDLIDNAVTTQVIEKMICEMEKLLGVYITLHDRLGGFNSPDGDNLIPEGRNYHSCPYCKAGRFSEPKWRDYCPRDCFQDSDLIAVREARPFTKTCWKGVFELVIPVMRGDTVVTVLYAGGWRGEIPAETSLTGKYRKMHEKLPVIPSEEALDTLKNILSVFGQGLMSLIENLKPSETEPDSRKKVITHFIRENAHRPVRLEDLAEHLFLSPSRTSHIVNQLFKMPFKQLLIQERMTRAGKLLLSNWPDMNAVAEAVGYDNVFYFNTAFKKWYGMPPGRFRRERPVKKDQLL